MRWWVAILGGLLVACGASGERGGSAEAPPVSGSGSGGGPGTAQRNVPAPAEHERAEARGEPSGDEVAEPVRLERGRPVTVGGVRVELREVVNEEIAAPDGSGAGGLAVATLAVGDEQVTLADGAAGYAQHEAWVGNLRVRLVEMGDAYAPFVILRLERADGEVLEERTVTLPGDEPRIGPGVRIVRWRHSHHEQRAGGPPSPLGVHLRLALEGASSPVRVNASLRLPQERTFSWRDYTFEVLDHEYGERMVLRVRRHALRPLR